MGKKAIAVNGGLDCPKCHREMQRYNHPPSWRPKANQPYYFSYWDICRPCMHFQHYEKAKIKIQHEATDPEAERRMSAIMEQLGEPDDKLPWEE